jgi:hypothetical protein
MTVFRTTGLVEGREAWARHPLVAQGDPTWQ